MSETALSAGARLKAAREQRGLSVPKAAGELHLEPWMVEALEAGEFDRVGPPVYSKDYLRRYAILLGLPPEQVLAGFGVVAPPAGVAAADPDVVAPARAALSTSQALGAGAIVLLLAGLLYWQPWSRRGPAESRRARADPEAPGTRAPAIVHDEPAVAAAPPAVAARSANAATGPQPAALGTAATPRPAGSDAAAAAPAEPGAGRARLRLSFTADSWVEVRDALGNKSFVGNGSANTVRTIAGQAPMHVFLRQGSGVQLEINGHTVAIGPQYFAGDVARFQAGADGVLRREPPREANASNTRPPG